MRTIGLLGGMSWESSAQYYRLINQETQRRLGGTHSARSVMVSVDFAEIEALQHAGDWDALTDAMIAAALQAERGGAQLLVICTNTMHRMADAVADALSIPLLHIADPVGRAIAAEGLTKVGLLGTAFTMEQPFLRDRLQRNFGLEVITPDSGDRSDVHRIIYDELVRGVVTEPSRALYRAIMQRMADKGAQAIILGCTEIMLLVDQSDSPVPLFDTTTLHALAAVEAALAQGGA
ncbi:MAG: aspartate/glutamate racemase family protein [Blastomonas fulva]|uniref:aspartate/glutamate racemase family protein n=1 Tax=Blastomonas fulva TaxID=1550728 RepID=UPI0024E21501|nr:aspartate/glutamate racemase family protein [Blastomonas fulva]MDK2757096.1 aspartate/glutamate racemase family protein [Blastomonas fulva]